MEEVPVQGVLGMHLHATARKGHFFGFPFGYFDVVPGSRVDIGGRDGFLQRPLNGRFLGFGL